MSDFYTGECKELLFVTAGDDLSIPLQLTQKTVKSGVGSQCASFTTYFEIQDGDVITVLFPDNFDGPGVTCTNYSVVDSVRGSILLSVPGSDSSSFGRFGVENPGTFKAYLVRNGLRSTFLFSRMLVCKDDNFKPFLPG